MKIFKPLKEVGDLVQKSLDSTRESIDKFLGKGFKGGLKNLFDFSAQGFIQTMDFELGIGILHLMMDGDQGSVETAIRFRNEAAALLEKLEEMATMVKRFKSEDLAEVKQAARDMEAYLSRSEPAAAEPRV